MKKKKLVFFLLLLFPLVAAAAENAPEKKEAPGKAAEAKPAPEKLSVTRHTITINGQPLDYTATAGRLHISDPPGKLRADIFFIAYVKEVPPAAPERPVTFLFNGGPGAASIWLNFGAFGPKQVLLSVTGRPSGPPYALADNADTLLDATDLVFIDPVGTGFSRPSDGVSADAFYGMEADVESVAEFVQAWVSRFQRWAAPKFIAGESYGGLRAVLLADALYESYGMAVNGLIVISPALEFQNFVFRGKNLLPYGLFLPTYAATAFYHRKLAAPLLQDLDKTLAEVQDWTLKTYLPALIRGDALGAAERNEIAAKLAAYTGLSETYIRQHKLKVTNRQFSRELLRSQGLILGILDSRLTAPAESVNSFLDDPGMVLTVGPYAGALNSHLRADLKYESDLAYRFFSPAAGDSWKWGSAIHGYPGALTALSGLIARFGYFRVFIARGCYDLDIGYFSGRYNIEHLELPADLKENVIERRYASGHQIYTNPSSLEKLKADVVEFLPAPPAQAAGAKR